MFTSNFEIGKNLKASSIIRGMISVTFDLPRVLVHIIFACLLSAQCTIQPLLHMKGRLIWPSGCLYAVFRNEVHYMYVMFVVQTFLFHYLKKKNLIYWWQYSGLCLAPWNVLASQLQLNGITPSGITMPSSNKDIILYGLLCLII